jgi:hypothetical protein
MPVLVTVLDFVLRPRSVLILAPPAPAAPIWLLLPVIGTGPPQAKNAAAIKTATPSSQSQLVRLIIRSLVMLTSLKMRAVNRGCPKNPARLPYTYS